MFRSSQLFADAEEVPVDLAFSAEELKELPDECRFQALCNRLAEAAATERRCHGSELAVKRMSYAKSKKEFVSLSSGSHVGVWLQGLTSKTLLVILTPDEASRDARDESAGSDTSSRTSGEDGDDDDDDDDERSGSDSRPIPTTLPKPASRGHTSSGANSRRSSLPGWTYDDDDTHAAADRDERIPSPAIFYGEEHDKMEDRMREQKVPCAATKDGQQALYDRFSQLKPISRREIVDAALRVQYSYEEMPCLYQDPVTLQRLADPPVYDWVEDDTVPPLTSKGQLKWYKYEPRVHGLKVAFPGWDFVANRRKAKRPRSAQDGHDDDVDDAQAAHTSAHGNSAPHSQPAAGQVTPPLSSGFGIQQPSFSQMQQQISWMMQMQMAQMMNAASTQPVAASAETLPAGWTLQWDPQYQCHYYQSALGTSQWHRPAPPAPPPLPALPAGWRQLFDVSTGRHYYCHDESNITQWHCPS